MADVPTNDIILEEYTPHELCVERHKNNRVMDGTEHYIETLSDGTYRWVLTYNGGIASQHKMSSDTAKLWLKNGNWSKV